MMLGDIVGNLCRQMLVVHVNLYYCDKLFCFPESTLEVGNRMALGGGVGGGDSILGAVPEERRKSSGAELRALWRKAIIQQILLLRMERENQKLQGETQTLTQ